MVTQRTALKAGELVVLEAGEYSGRSNIAVVRVLRDADLLEIEPLVRERLKQLEVKFEYESYTAALLFVLTTAGIVEELAYSELNLDTFWEEREDEARARRRGR